MSTCLKHSTVVGCWNKADTTKENVVIHYTYATNTSGVEIIKATRYTTPDGTPIVIPVGDTVSAGSCPLVNTTLTATIGTLRATANGTVTAGKQSVTFIGVDGSGTVNGVAINTGESKTFEGYYNNATQTYYTLPAINYTASALNVIDIHFID